MTTITEIITTLQAINREVGCDGKSINSHKYPSNVSFYVEGDEDNLP